MQKLARALLEENDFKSLVAGIDSGSCPAVITGVSEIHRAHIAASIRAETNRPIVFICSDEDESARIVKDISSLTMEEPVALGLREFTFHNAEVVSRQHEQKRISALYAMHERKSPITVMTVCGALQRTVPPKTLSNASFKLRVGGAYDLKGLSEKLVLCGYSRSDQVEGPGQFAQRGGILDFFSPAYEEPVRCEFFGDEIDFMSFFDVGTQRRSTKLEESLIFPVAETLPSLYDGEHGTGAMGLSRELEEKSQLLSKRKNVNPELLKNIDSDIMRLKTGLSLPAADKYIELISPMATALDYICEDSIIILNDPSRVKDRAKAFLDGLALESLSLLEGGILESGLVRFSEDWEGFVSQAENYPVIMTDNFTVSNYPLSPRTILNISAKRLPSYGGSFETAASDIAHYKASEYRTIVLCRDKRRAALLKEYLEEREISTGLDSALLSLPLPGSCILTEGELSAGMEYPGIKLAILTEGQLLGQSQEYRKRSKRRRATSAHERLQSFTDLAPGDLVVHDAHGIGRFVGFVKLTIDGVEKEYVKVAYAGTDSLYVPATQLDMIAKYIGGGNGSENGASQVRLSKMGGADWNKVKTRAKSAAREMARELIKLYAARQRVKGIEFPPDSVWQNEFEEKFGYPETDDQLKCTSEIKADMEKSVPMDRLLCGDVGYGKTEVALRAVMKCVLGGYQAAMLVPTTVLAQQHFVTSMRRFAGYPINIEVMSRFKSTAENKKTLKGLESGSIDFVIGTHRMLQKDISFKKLGLLVVDEEQRFGVSHKERLKELAKQVDVLTLSATPIPRTLNMALSGIRDMSTIEEPPQSRRPVQTYVLEHEWGVLCDAIRRETSRGGQVYYLHNRIDNIERVATRLKEMLEGLSITVAHGKMDEEHLSDVMERMTAGEIQVLVCTTIIESGIDIPNVNTLIVEDADKLGLAQLHQIRGRVGRSPRRAFAYLTFRRGKVLSEIAEKRLSAIREFAEFNSGFKIAMRDLEIRGAGSLLGAEQSGHMLSVGYDMYLKLLEEAVLEEKGEKPKTKADCPADLNVNAGIPEKYVPSAQQRMDLYRRIALIRSEADCNEMLSEIIDRYGPPPREVTVLAAIAMLRYDASNAGFAEITQKEGSLHFKLTDFDMQRISSLYSKSEYKGRVKVLAGTQPAISLKLVDADVVEQALAFVKQYAAS